MLESFVEVAKATVRRAGAGDPPQNVDRSGRDGLGNHDDTPPDPAASGSGLSPSSPLVVDDLDGDAACSSTAQSVSRSFSLLKASGARAMAPVKKALGADPEAMEARESLTKYKAKLAAAVVEAAATAATRREERELLTKALAVQENDLRCWGYLSVLPSFREHRRRETDRAQLRVIMSERREEVISAKLEEVARILRSLPIIGPWTNKPSGTADTGGGEECGGYGRFREEAFVVAPSDLLAFDEDLASARRQLVSCDRACAAAADAFAMKVVDAGGLEPRSAEDRAQTLLALLSRYHVLGGAVTGEAGSEAGQQAASAAAAAAAAAARAEPAQVQAEKQDTSDGELTEEREKGEETGEGQDRAVAVHRSRCEGDAAAGLDNGHGDEGDDDDGVDRSAGMGGGRDGRGKAAVGLRFSARGREECEEAFMELMLDERNREGRLLQRFLTMAQAKKSPPLSSLPSSSSSMKPLSLRFSSASSSAAEPVAAARPASHTTPTSRKPARAVGASGSGYFAAAAAAAFSSIRVKARGGGGGGGGSTSASTTAVKAGDANAANTEASAKKSAANATAVLKAAKPVASNASTRDLSSWSEAQRSVCGAKKEPDEEDWEGEGSVGPQVVKAFINYFSREYLVNRFDVPDWLVPSLTELVTLLVFRQARRLVFGYDRRSVTKNDCAWREKAGVVRSVCLVELGAPPEYAPAVKTNASGTSGAIVEVAEAAVEMIVSEEVEVDPRKSEDPVGRPDDASAREAAPAHDSAAALAPGGSADYISVAPDSSGEAAVRTCADGATTAGPDAAQVSPSTTSDVKSLKEDITAPLAGVAGAPALSEGVADSPARGKKEKARAQEDKKDASGLAEEVTTPVAQGEDKAGVSGPTYARASREFGRLGDCMTPAQMLVVVKSATNFLIEDAASISGSEKPLDADTLLPLLVHALVHANLPRVHEALNFLINFRGPSWGGEQAYYVTCIEAAVAFVLDWKADHNRNDLSATPSNPDAAVLPSGTVNDRGNHGSKAMMAKIPEGDGDGGDAAFAAKRAAGAREMERKQQKEGREALMRLGIFLERHEVQEDTVDVLSCAGWI